MTAVDPGPTQGFTVRIYKTLASNPSLSWANSYELITVGDPGVGAEADIISALVSFEQAIHLDDVFFDRAVFSTFAEDGVPYDPESFIVYPLSGAGTVSTVGLDPRSLNDCLFVRRTVASGRTGKLFYRRCLTDEDVTAPSGSLALSPLSPVWARVSDAVDANLVDYFGTASDFRLAMIAQGQVVRNITNLQTVGARVRQYNNRWFDVP